MGQNMVKMPKCPNKAQRSPNVKLPPCMVKDIVPSRGYCLFNYQKERDYYFLSLRLQRTQKHIKKLFFKTPKNAAPMSKKWNPSMVL